MAPRAAPSFRAMTPISVSPRCRNRCPSAATPPRRPRSSNTGASTRSPPSSKALPRRSTANAPTRSPPTRSCTASPPSKRSCARPQLTARSRSRAEEREPSMPITVLYPEDCQIPDDSLEREIFGPEVRLIRRTKKTLSELDPADCAEADGLMIMRYAVTAEDIARFPRLRAIVRMGVGYDKIDRAAAAARNVLVCNVPDYGTTEVADHAMALALALRRGVVFYHERLRSNPPAPWGAVKNDLIRRLGVQTFGIVGLGRIGTAVALRARAFGFRVMFYDPYLPNGADLALGIGRAATLEDLLRETDTLSVHAPLTPETRLMLGHDQLSLLRPGAVGATGRAGRLTNFAG